MTIRTDIKYNNSSKRLAYTSLVRPILEYGAAWWDPHRDGQIHVLDRVQNKAAKFTYHANGTNWETSTQRRKIARICALHSAYSGEQAWKAIGDRLKWPYYLSRVDHDWKIRNRRQRTDIGKYSFANRPSDSLTGYRQKFWGLSPVNKTVLERGLGI